MFNVKIVTPAVGIRWVAIHQTNDPADAASVADDLTNMTGVARVQVTHGRSIVSDWSRAHGPARV